MVFTILMTRLRQAVKEEFAALADAQDGAALQADTKSKNCPRPRNSFPVSYQLVRWFEKVSCMSEVYADMYTEINPAILG